MDISWWTLGALLSAATPASLLDAAGGCMPGESPCLEVQTVCTPGKAQRRGWVRSDAFLH